MTIHIGSKTLVAIVAVLALAVGAAAVGLVPAYQLLWLGLVLVCPLMMFFMMRGMHGSQNEAASSSAPHSPPSQLGMKQGHTPEGYSK